MFSAALQHKGFILIPNKNPGKERCRGISWQVQRRCGGAARRPRELPRRRCWRLSRHSRSTRIRWTRCRALCCCGMGEWRPRGGGAPYGPQSPHSMYSLSKSFTSTGIGLAVAEGLLTVDDPVLKFFPDDAPANPSANLQGDARAAPAGDEHRTPGRHDRTACSAARATTGRERSWRCRSSMRPARGLSTTPPPPTCSRPSSPG